MAYTQWTAHRLTVPSQSFKEGNWGWRLGFLFRVWPGQSFKTGCNFDICCVLKMFRWISHKGGQVFESTPTPEILTLQLFYRAFLTTPTIFFFSCLYMFWSLSTNIETYFFISLNVNFFIGHPSRQFCCNKKVLLEVEMILTQKPLGCQYWM